MIALTRVEGRNTITGRIRTTYTTPEELLWGVYPNTECGRSFRDSEQYPFTGYGKLNVTRSELIDRFLRTRQSWTGLILAPFARHSNRLALPHAGVAISLCHLMTVAQSWGRAHK